jgi:RNA polymerase sigma-70 factor (ECF subfamily)
MPNMAAMPPKQASTEPSGRETIEELFTVLESPLLSYALRLAGQLGAAEDLVQEAFMRLHVQFAEVREPRRWLYRTVHNLALNHRRDSGKIVPLDAGTEDGEPAHAEVADPQPLPDEQIARWEGIGLVRLSLQGLDQRSREVVQLKFNDGLSYRQISARTGINVSNVGYVLHNALKSIGDELARNGVVP